MPVRQLDSCQSGSALKMNRVLTSKTTPPVGLLSHASGKDRSVTELSSVGRGIHHATIVGCRTSVGHVLEKVSSTRTWVCAACSEPSSGISPLLMMEL